MANWVFDTTRIVDPNIYPAPNFNILDTAGGNHTRAFMKTHDYLIFLVAVDLSQAKPKHLQKLDQFYKDASKAGYQVIGLTASIKDDIKKYSQNLGVSVPFYNTDDKELRTMIRSNPGIVLLKNARVTKKWHFRDIPAISDFEREFPLNKSTN